MKRENFANIIPNSIGVPEKSKFSADSELLSRAKVTFRLDMSQGWFKSYRSLSASRTFLGEQTMAFSDSPVTALGESTQIPSCGIPADVPRLMPAAGSARPRSLCPFKIRWDVVCVALVCLVALFLASFPAGNSEFWLHLGTGKAYLSGQAHFGVEPFTPPQPGHFWVNHSWLFDVILGVCYPEVVGGAGLVLLKALLVVGLAVCLIRAAGAGQSVWIAAASTALTLVALGPWLDVQPILVSIAFFGLTIALLEQDPQIEAAPWRWFWRCFAPILVLTLLWVNVDQWFVLGPLSVGVYLLGKSVAGGRTRAVWYFSLAAVAMLLLACLMNPHHVFVLASALEGTLLNGADRIAEDPFFHGHLITPLQLRLPGHLAAPASAAYWSLVFLGAIAFVLNRERWNWPRAALWLCLFLLSGYQPQARPFFAVAGGLILALNVKEFVSASRARPGLVVFFRAIPAGQALLILVLAALVAASWTGALQGGPCGPRTWRVQREPCLDLAAEQIARWREQGRLEDKNGFLFSLELANYFAWLRPSHEALINAHGYGNAEDAADYLALRQALLGQEAVADSPWRAILRRRHIDHVVLYSNDQRLVELAVSRLLPDNREWVLLFWKGRTVIFGWQDPEQSNARFTAMRLTPVKAAFSEDCVIAPRTAPGRFPEPYHWWDAFHKSQDYRSMDIDEACLALTFFDAFRPRYADAAAKTWNNVWFAGYVGLAGSVAAPHVHELARFGCAATKGSPLSKLFFETRDLGPRSAPYLAIRAARRVLRANPENPFAYLLLGEAYFRLGSRTQEKAWVRNFPEFGRVRTAQMLAAYSQALLLKPDLAYGHYRLAELFKSIEYKDLALQHLQEYLKWSATYEPGPGEARDVAQLRKIASRQQKEIAQLQEEYEINSPHLKVVDRARLAGQKGLAALALDILLQEDVAAFGTPGMDLELKLLLLTGQTEKVYMWMDEEKEKVLPAYWWNRAQLDAAIGAYDEADRDLKVMATIPNLRGEKIPLRNAATLVLGHGILDYNESLFFKNPGALLASLGVMPEGLGRLLLGREGTPSSLMMVCKGLEGEADVAVLRGLLALECGRTVHAADLFRKAMLFHNSAAGRFFDDNNRYSRVIAKEALDMLAGPNPRF